MRFDFNNFTDSDGYTWSTNGDPKIIQAPNIGNCLEMDGKSYLHSERTDISNFGLGEFTIEFNVKPALKGRGRQMMLYSTPLIDPNLGESYFVVVLNQFDQPAIQVTNMTTGLHKASGIDKTGIELFNGNWHKFTCKRDRQGLIHWYHNDIEKKPNNTWLWRDVDITSTFGSCIGIRHELIELDRYKFEGQLDYLKITKDF